MTNANLEQQESPSITTKHYVLDAQYIMPVIASNLRRSTSLIFLSGLLLVLFSSGLVVAINSASVSSLLFAFGMLVAWVFVILTMYRASVKKAYARLVERGLFSKPQYHEISAESFSSYFEDGLHAKVALNGLFKRVEKQAKHYRLYIRQPSAAMIFIPLDAFASEEDRQRFEAILRQHKILVINKK